MTVKPRKVKPLYQVLLLPAREVAARHQTLAEASAWVRTYNEALACPQVRAVIAEEPTDEKTSSHCSQAA